MRKISTKIILAIALCSTILATVIGTISINTFSKKLTEKSDSNLILMSEKAAQQMDMRFNMIRKTVDNMAIEAGVKFNVLKAKDDKNYVKNYFLSLRNFVKEISSNSDNNLDGYVLLDSSFSRTPYVDELIYIKDLKGKFVYSPPLNPLQELQTNPKKYDWYLKPMHQKKGLWTDIYLDPALKIQMISYVTPVKSNNVVVGMAGMDITFDGLKKIVQEIKPYKGSYAFLVNGKNDFVVHPKYKLTQNLYSVDNKHYEKLTQQFNMNSSGFIRLGDEVISYAKLSNDFKLCVVVPENEIMSEVIRLKGIITLIIIFGAIVAIITAAILGTKIANPIKVLIDNMSNVEEGKLDLAIFTNNKDEIGLVYDKFNSMVNSLKNAKEDIEIYTRDLENKNAELERFTYTVSHDLKSPLITIKGFAGAIAGDLEKGRNDRISSDLKRIENASEKMEELLEGLLELSRIGRVVNPPEYFSMFQLTHQIVELLYGSINSRRINLKIDEELPNAYGDKHRIREVLQNLVENSIKFMDKAEGFIEVGFIKKNNQIIYFVSDNGPGIDMKYYQKIFGLFDKLDNNMAGTGIGLALVKRIIEFHKGEIWVESSIGKGSKFYFTLGLKEK